MTKTEFATRAVAIGWVRDPEDPDRFNRGRQLALILDSGELASGVAILERKTRQGRRSGRLIPQLVVVWSGSVEAFLL